MRKQIAAGNWKMNTTFSSAMDLGEKISAGDRSGKVHTILGVPFPFLHQVKAFTDQYAMIDVSAQNCHQESSGAYTGEVSASMLQSMDIPFVILGHSERRAYFSEDAAILNSKLNQALLHNIQPIFCCGEALEIRQSGAHINYVIQQLEETIFKLSEEDFSKIVIAYEPVWAIGTGETASAAQAQEMHSAIRSRIAEVYNDNIAQNCSILYGGSVKPGNAEEIFGQEDVDGGLVGGASLDADSFLAIINAF